MSGGAASVSVCGLGEKIIKKVIYEIARHPACGGTGTNNFRNNLSAGIRQILYYINDFNSWGIVITVVIGIVL